MLFHVHVQLCAYVSYAYHMSLVGASTMYWGTTQCKNDNMTVLLVVSSTVLVVPPIWSADRRYISIYVHQHILCTVSSTPEWSYSVTHARTHTHARTRTRTHAHARAHTRTHTHTHTHTHRDRDQVKSIFVSLCVSMSAIGDVPSNNGGNRASRAQTAATDGVGHRRLVVAANSPKTQNSLPRSAAVPSGTAPARTAPARRTSRDVSFNGEDDGSTQEPPTRRPRNVLTRCCDCSRSSTCALSKPTARSQACPCRVANKRCTSCACFAHCQNKRAPLPPPTTATLRCFFTAPSMATAPDATPPAIDPNPSPAPTPHATETPPAPLEASQQ